MKKLTQIKRARCFLFKFNFYHFIQIVCFSLILNRKYKILKFDLLLTSNFYSILQIRRAKKLFNDTKKLCKFYE